MRATSISTLENSDNVFKDCDKSTTLVNDLNTFNQNIPENVHDTSISSNNVPNSEDSFSDSSYFLKFYS